MTNRMVVMALLLTACTRAAERAAPTANSRAVIVDGSSTVYPVSKAVAEELEKEAAIRTTVNESGTTGGFRKFCAGQTDISGASRPIEASEAEACSKAGIAFLELPIGYDGLAVAVNAANDWADHLTVAELKRIWSPEAAGVINNWRQVRDSFPDRPLHLVGPGADSGTFDYFTQAVVGTQRSSRTDYFGSEDDNELVRRVSQDPNALGYFGVAYVVRNHAIKAVPIDDEIDSNGRGAVAPLKANVANGTYQPLSRPIFIYVSTAALRRPEVEKYVAFYLQVAHELSAEVGYVSLHLKADALAKERFNKRVAGSMFSTGTPIVGVTMERLLEAQAR